MKRPQLSLVPVICNKCFSFDNICSHLAFPRQPVCSIGHRGPESACFQVRDGCKHNWDFLSSTKWFATFLVFFIFMSLPLPHWFIPRLGRPRGPLFSFSHPTWDARWDETAANTLHRWHARTYAEGGVFTRRTVPNRSWQRCCIRSSSHLNTDTHTFKIASTTKKKFTVLMPKNAASPEWA